MQYYKVLDIEGYSCNGGQSCWKLPTKGEDGKWKPGEWMEEIKGDLKLCENGYHLCRTDDLLKWLGEAIYEAEYKGDKKEGEDKIVVRACRLLRKCEGWTEGSARLFACWCARNTPLANGRTTWDLLTDKRSREAIEIAERYARGDAKKEDLAAAWAAAGAAARAAARAASEAAAGAASEAASEAAARAAARDAAWDASEAAADAAQIEELLTIINRKGGNSKIWKEKKEG